MRVERTLGTYSPNLSFSPRVLKSQELLGVARPVVLGLCQGAAYSVLEALFCICSLAACCWWPVFEWVERTKERTDYSQSMLKQNQEVVML